MRNIDKEVLGLVIQVSYPVLLWGKPGIGKTSAIKKYCADMGKYCEVVIASHKDPVDINGIMVERAGEYVSLTPDWVNRVCDRHGILFLDEFSRATNVMQNVLIDLVDERRAGGREFPDDVVVVAAANPVDASSGVFDLNAALSNRMVHVDCDVDHTEWIEGIMSGWSTGDPVILPDNWKVGIPKARQVVTGYISANPTAIIDEPEQLAMQGKPWPSPRSWERVVNIFAAWDSIKDSLKDPLLVAQRAIGGAVGMGQAISFMNYHKNLDLPQPEDLLNGAPLPKDPSSIYVCSLSAVTYALHEPTEKLWNQAWALLGRIADEGKSDLVMSAAKMLVDHFKLLVDSGVASIYPKDIYKFTGVLQDAGLMPSRS
jgi:hypothetical protein